MVDKAGEGHVVSFCHIALLLALFDSYSRVVIANLIKATRYCAGFTCNGYFDAIAES
jgi:hypothetical protein